MQAVSRRLLGALTDFGYLVLSASPRLRPLYRRWAGRRYRGLAPIYGSLAAEDPMYLRPLRTALERLDCTPNRIVEVGAGTGAATAVLGERFPEATLVAVDASLEMLQHLMESPGVALHPVVGDAFSLPLRPQAADVALVHNAPFDLEELLRATTPSGLVLIVLSSARWIPAALRRRLLRARRLTVDAAREEWTIEDGVVWVFRRNGTGKAYSR